MALLCIFAFNCFSGQYIGSTYVNLGYICDLEEEESRKKRGWRENGQKNFGRKKKGEVFVCPKSGKRREV